MGKYPALSLFLLFGVVSGYCFFLLSSLIQSQKSCCFSFFFSFGNFHCDYISVLGLYDPIDRKSLVVFD